MKWNATLKPFEVRNMKSNSEHLQYLALLSYNSKSYVYIIRINLRFYLIKSKRSSFESNTVLFLTQLL